MVRFELMRDQPLPWLEWPVALKLTGAVMPMLGLISWPHAQIRGGSLATAVLDIAGGTLLSALLFWSMVVAPGLTAQTSSAGLESLVVIGSVLHVAIVGGFAIAARAAGRGPWHAVYQRLATGAAAGSVLLTTNAYPMANGTYTTGSIGDIGWIVPFCNRHGHERREQEPEVAHPTLAQGRRQPGSQRRCRWRNTPLTPARIQNMRRVRLEIRNLTLAIRRQ